MKAILFDLEGTLAYYEKKHDPVAAAALARKLGYKIYHQEWEAARKFVLFVDAPKAEMNSWNDFISRIFARLQIKAKAPDIATIAGYYRKNTRFRFFDDAAAVRKLSVRKAIVTSVPRFYFDSLDTDGFDIFTSHETGLAKGNPEFFIRVLKKIGVKATDALIVGNNIDCDIRPAKEAGIRSLLIDRAGRGDIASLAELKNFL